MRIAALVIICLLINFVSYVHADGMTLLDHEADEVSVEQANDGSAEVVLTEKHRAALQQYADMHERKVKLMTASTEELIEMFIDEAKAECETDEDWDNLYVTAHEKSLEARHEVGFHFLELRDAEHYLTSASFCSQHMLWIGNAQRIVTLAYSLKKTHQYSYACLGLESVVGEVTKPTLDELQWGLAGTVAGREWYLNRRSVDPKEALTEGVSLLGLL